MSETNKGLFHTFVNAGEAAIAAGRAKIAEKLLKRRFESAHLDAQSKLMDLEAERENLLGKIASDPMGAAERFDVNRLVNIALEAQELADAIETIENEYTVMFGDGATLTRVEE